MDKLAKAREAISDVFCDRLMTREEQKAALEELLFDIEVMLKALDDPL